MNARIFSLRAKLICAIAAVIALASFPLIYMSYQDAYKHSIDAATDKFSNVTRILKDAAELSYLDTQTVVAEKVEIEKDDISATLSAIEGWINENRLPEMMPTLKFLEDTWATSAAVVSPSGEFFYLSRTIREMWKENARDYLGVPFREYLKRAGYGFTRDDFSFFRIKDASATEGSLPYLAGLRRVNGYTVLIFQQLEYLEEPLRDSGALLEGRLADSLRSIDLNPDSNVAVFSGTGRILVTRGTFAKHDSEHFLAEHQDLLKKARNEDVVAETLDDDGSSDICVLRYFKALDWYFLVTIPTEVVSEPALKYARTLGGWVVAAFLFASMLGIALISWFLKPMQALSEAAGRIEKFDFMQKDTAHGLQSIAAGLPSGSRDEVGLVARAFREMVAALDKNISALKASVARQHSIEGELNAAREIQNGMLPPADERFRAKHFEAAALIDAAKEVGGDFYDVFELPQGRMALILGDVSGKGVSAALLMSVTLTLMRSALMDGLSPAAAVKKVNDQIAARNPSCMFATLWVGIFDPETGRLEFTNGGHCPPLAVRRSADGAVTGLEWNRKVGGPLVGALDMAEFVDFEETIEPNELFLVYSDGVSEAMNEAQKLFGEDGIEAVAKNASRLSPRELIDNLMAAIIHHRGSAPQSDDITILAFERKMEEA